jgi:two-component system CheB/CheR fusion protein
MDLNPAADSAFPPVHTSPAADGALPAADPTQESAALREANQQLVLATLRAQAAEAELREAARHKDEFLAMLGHELRNPLVPIRNAAEVLHRIAGDDPRVAWVHDMLVRQVGHITRLVDDLLDISLISRGALQLHLEPVDVGAVIGRAVDAVEPLIQRKRHHLRCDVALETAWVQGDAIRLTQVFENLLTNAAKYTPDTGEIAVTLTVADQQAVIRVRDNGLGIAPGMESRIFELFVQDARAADRSEGGLGIGLALVRHLIELHGGAIETSSQGAGQGTEFVIRLPLLAEAQLPARQAPLAIESSGTGRVMIVDDDVEGGESMAILLKLYGYDVDRATDLPSALQVGKAFQPQAVLMDISMPDADGYEVARQLGALPEVGGQVAYIAVTGFGQASDFKRSKDAGFFHHLVKPVDPDELDLILKSALLGHRADHAPGAITE